MNQLNINKEFLNMAVIAILFLSINTVMAHSGFENSRLIMSAKTLSKHLDNPNLHIVDARDAEVYEFGHIPGAVNIPISTISRSEALDNGKVVKALVMLTDNIQPVLRAAGINANDRIVIYTDSDSRAARVWWALDYYGHQNLAILDGGINAWEAHGGAIDTDDVNVEMGDFVAKADPDKIADYNYVNDRLGDSNTILVDAVSPEMHTQGHIPGSGSAFYENTFDRDNNSVLKPANQLQKLLSDAGASKDGKEVIFYCGGGWFSAQDLFVARTLGYENVRLYDGSRKDWVPRGGKMDSSSN